MLLHLNQLNLQHKTYTIYTSCCNLNKGIYYYSTYHGHTIKAVDMHKTNLDNKDLTCYPMIDEEVFFEQN